MAATDPHARLHLALRRTLDAELDRLRADPSQSPSFGLSADLVEQLLADESLPADLLPPPDLFLPSSSSSSSHCAVASRPFSATIASKLFDWSQRVSAAGDSDEDRRAALLSPPAARETGQATDGLSGVRTAFEVLVSIASQDQRLCDALLQLCDDGGPEAALGPLLAALGFAGLAALLGCGRSEGTAQRWPPSALELAAAFHAKQANVKPPHVALTVGARAVSKHAHRAQSDLFWGVVRGRVVDKNQQGAVVLSKLLADPAWMNVHSLPPYTDAFFEMRNSLGYGARWAMSDAAGPSSAPYLKMFRGLLEPHAVKGHGKGWIH